MRTLLVLGLAVVLTACSATTNHYLKPDTTRQHFDRDYKDCFWESSASLWVSIPVALVCTPCVLYMADQRDAKIPACMQARGYTVSTNSGYTPGLAPGIQ